ncbi:MAG: hypothetical protein JJ863_21510 [Deltaproteobacteria bacterium]|nr:hypothetical protein [Deltaproteobacteria bacterium]
MAIRNVDILGRVPLSEGAVEADAHGFAKPPTFNVPRTVVNEYISMRLAIAAGLPVAPGTIVYTDDGGPLYLSLSVAPDGRRPPPADCAGLWRDEPKTAAGIVLFDILILNTDRFADNLAYTHPVQPAAIFDHDRALLGSRDDPPIGSRLLEVVEDHELGAHVDDPTAFDGWWRRLQFHPGVLQDLMADLVRRGLISRAEGHDIVDFLQRRSAILLDLLARSPFLPKVGRPTTLIT